MDERVLASGTTDEHAAAMLLEVNIFSSIFYPSVSNRKTENLKIEYVDVTDQNLNRNYKN